MYDTDLFTSVKYLRLHRVISGLIKDFFLYLAFFLGNNRHLMPLGKMPVNKDARSHLCVWNCLVLRLEKNPSVLSNMV